MEKQKPKVLYIDDEEPNLLAFEMLYQMYYKIYTATSAEKALEIIKSKELQVIIADQRMQGMTGVELFNTISETNPETIRILLTAYMDVQAIIDAINIGNTFHYMNKPYDHNHLKNIIDKGIDVYNLRQQNKLLIEDLRRKNIKLEEGEKRYRIITETVTDYIYKIFVKNDNLFMTVHSEACIAVSGYSAKEFEERPSLWLDIVHKSDREKVNTFILATIKSKECRSLEYRILKKKSGEISWIRNTLILFKDHDEKIIEYNGVIKDITEQKQLENKILSTIIETEENQRAHFAQELHDGLGPLMSTIKLYLQWMLKAERKANIPELLKKAEKIVEEAYSTVREISNRLSPHILKNFGFITAIKSFINRINDVHPLTFKLTTNYNQRQNSIAESILYRVLTECINNTIKHAKAQNVEINIENLNEQIHISYKDDGIGFDKEKVKQQKTGIGLFNMQNRLNSIGGSMNINSQPGKGMEINVELDIQK